jgi:hypothetical protein
MNAPGNVNEGAIIVARHESTPRSGGKLLLDNKIELAWTTLLGDAEDRAEIAHLFDVPVERISELRCPFESSFDEAGLTGVEIGILFASGFAAGLRKQLRTEAAKAVWNYIFRLLQVHNEIGKELRKISS